MKRRAVLIAVSLFSNAVVLAACLLSRSGRAPAAPPFPPGLASASAAEAAQTLCQENGEEVLYALLRRNGGINLPQLPCGIWAAKVQGRTLGHVTLKRRDARGAIDLVIQAREGELHVDAARKTLLIHLRHAVSSSTDGTHGYFEDRVWEFPLL